MSKNEMNLLNFDHIFEKSNSSNMPVLFIGHGNPMFAITKNPYSTNWSTIGKAIPKPKAILCISAHWLTNKTAVTISEKPNTIHDFGGFPEELFQQQYPAPGATDFANLTIESIHSVNIQKDSEWGYDHGTWSILRNMFPEANIPVFQLSINPYKPNEFHFDLGRELSFLRTKGVLIIGSGNIVHNLRQVKWNEDAKPFDWAIEFDSFVKNRIEDNNLKAILEFDQLGKIANLAHPTKEHFIPLFYILGLKATTDQFYFFNDSIDMGSMSMRSVIFY